MPDKNITVNTLRELLDLARAIEADDPPQAIKYYLQALKKDKHNTIPYDRLMILYRKSKALDKEMAIIDKAIKTFEDLHNQHTTKAAKDKAEVTKLSKALMRSTGLVDKAGKPLYSTEPVTRWKRRKALLENKM